MHSFFVEIVAGLESVVSARGYALLLCSSGEDAAKERRELEALKQRQVDGLVFASAHATGNEDLLRQLTDAGKCLVMIDRDDHPDIRCHRVLTDDERVGAIATSHLLGLGHRAIAHIAGPPIIHAKRREQGYRQALRDARVAVRPEWIARAGFIRHQHRNFAVEKSCVFQSIDDGFCLRTGARNTVNCIFHLIICFKIICD